MANPTAETVGQTSTNLVGNPGEKPPEEPSAQPIGPLWNQSPNDPRRSIRCKFFLHGACKLYSDCPFSHDIKDKPSMICTYYLKGECTYGKQCKFDHVKPDHLKKEGKAQNIPLRTEPQAMSVNYENVTPVNFETFNVDAPVFQPGQKMHFTVSSQVSNGYDNAIDSKLTHSDSVESLTAEEVSNLMCPFAAVRECPYGEECHYVHGSRCDICELQCLNPLDPEQQKEHRKICLESHERDMEFSFAIQRSENMTCSICLDAVLERENPSERRFGILENCVHAFCLSCIRKWRKSSGAKVVKACPICRVSSGFVTPSELWIDNADEKRALIECYREALSVKDCRYFDKGNGNCPFGTSCFYKHAYADGSLQAKEKPKMRFCEDSDGNSRTVRDQRLWDFIEDREMQVHQDWADM